MTDDVTLWSKLLSSNLHGKSSSLLNFINFIS